jgi:predicted GIY-YIG superfamily endonuclease
MNKERFPYVFFENYLYVLELSQGKFYCGITSNPMRRFKQHKNGWSNSFVKENLPILGIKYNKLFLMDWYDALEQENLKTIELIEKYGIENVSGGIIIGDLKRRTKKYNSLKKRLGKK